MNAVTFGVYSAIMKKFGYKMEDMEYDTLENLQKSFEGGVCKVRSFALVQKMIPSLQAVQQIPAHWNEASDDKKLSTLATDGPNIITIQEPLISSISYTRMYPEQMLWACIETPKKEEEPNVWSR